MEKNYNPKQFEERIYKEWLEGGYFRAEVDAKKKPFTILMPPPNITGQLHIGHALTMSIQDTIIRFKRMQGYSALWLPGTDHASIATEAKIVEDMKKEGLSKQKLGRPLFLKRAYEWNDKYGGKIVDQLKRLGSSCDFSRFKFTMDEDLNRAVKKVFVYYYNKGLIYKANRIIHWCTGCKTALSDAEVEYDERAGSLWHIKYPLKDGGGFITIATTRPETMLGDVAVAVNPDDKRYKHLIGKTAVLPLLNRDLKIIADAYVEKDFGTGCVKITPAHDPNDYEIGLRHNLPLIRIMNDDGTINDAGGKYCGQDRYEARKNIVKDLEAGGLLVKVAPHKLSSGGCQRCKTVVEPLVSLQWYLKMDGLAKAALEAVENGQVKIIPKRFEKVYYHWMRNIKDWCISRQLWWGHRIPVYYCACGHEFASEDEPIECPKCKSKSLVQDEGVLDTWFSSALWPFSTLGFPKKTKDLKYFYPSNVLVTAYDILFFWVARMIFTGIEFMKEPPFKEVLFNGLVRDAQGRKLSKSLGNGIDPIEIIEQSGADSLRFTLMSGVSMINDTRFYPEKLESSRNFMNKLWNASRFALTNADNFALKDIKDIKLNYADKWILTRLNETIKKVTKGLEAYELGNVCGTIYGFVWNSFCDYYIEFCKPMLYSDNFETRNDTLNVLFYVLENILRLMHPVVPFITAEVYSALKEKNNKLNNIIIEKYPEFDKKRVFKNETKYIESVIDIIKSLRNLKASMNVPPSKRTTIYILETDAEYLKQCVNYVEKLGSCSSVNFIKNQNELSGINERMTKLITASCEIYIPLGELVDIEKELLRLKKESENYKTEIARAENKLNNKGFVNNAPKELIAAEKQKLEEYKKLFEKTEEQIRVMND